MRMRDGGWTEGPGALALRANRAGPPLALRATAQASGLRPQPQLSETAAKVLRSQRAVRDALSIPGTSTLTGPEEVRARVHQPWHVYEEGSDVADEQIQIHTHDAREGVLEDGAGKGKGERG